MSWAYVPGVSVSNVDLERFSQVAAGSVTWRGKDSRSRTWLQRWSKESWLRHLSGLTCDPLTAARGVVSWILSARATRASLSPWQAGGLVPPTPATSGPTSGGSSTSPSLGCASSRTSPLICGEEDLRSSETFDRWASALRSHCLQRRKSGPRTSESAFSSLLPTPTASLFDSNQGGAEGRVGPIRYSLTGLARRGLLWPTSTVCGNGNRKGSSPTSGDGLATAAGPGPLNPAWVEWLMGWPIGSTAYACSETG